MAMPRYVVFLGLLTFPSLAMGLISLITGSWVWTAVTGGPLCPGLCSSQPCRSNLIVQRTARGRRELVRAHCDPTSLSEENDDYRSNTSTMGKRAPDHMCKGATMAFIPERSTGTLALMSSARYEVRPG